EAFLQQLGALVMTSICSVSIGLLLSTMVASSEAAMALTPIALIPQVVLGGLMVPATTIPHISWLMYAVPARWGFEASVLPERLAIAKEEAWLIDLKRGGTSSGDFITDGHFECATAQLASEDLNGAWAFVNYETVWLPYAVLGGLTFSLLIIMCVVLRRRDPV
ncbi:MAG: ABC transporter permease, partial [Polyangiaceae bacterium]